MDIRRFHYYLMHFQALLGCILALHGERLGEQSS